MSRYSDYLDNIRSSEMSWRYELLGPRNELLASSVKGDTGNGVWSWAPTAPPVQFDRGGASTRTASLRIPVTNPDFIPKSRGSALHPEAGSKVRLSAGLDIGGGEIKWWPQGTMFLDETEVTSNGGVAVMDLQLLDATSPVRSELANSFSFTADEPVEDALDRLLRIVVPEGAFSISPTGFTVPSAWFAAGAKINEIVNDLLGGCGHELTADVTGRLITRAVPGSADPGTLERWSYGPSGLPIENLRRLWRKREPQGVLVTGGAIQNQDPSITRKVLDTDPSSLGFFSGAGQITLPTRSFSWLHTVPQADEAGYAELRRIGHGPGTITFETLPNPALRPYDFIDVEDEAADVFGVYEVIGFSLPLEIRENSKMGILARRSWDPELRFRGSVALNPGFETTVSDDFDRADGDLQGTNWTEHEWSWGIYQNAAVQRYDGGWSMALWNKAMAYSNHSASVDVVKVPPNRLVGPVIRSSGGFEGYAALVDAQGVIHLESWVGGKVAKRLTSYNSGGSPVGKTILLQGLGTTITVDLDGATVISITNDQHLGTRVGMLGLGGPETNAPTLDNFAAAQAS